MQYWQLLRSVGPKFKAYLPLSQSSLNANSLVTSSLLGKVKKAIIIGNVLNIKNNLVKTGYEAFGGFVDARKGEEV